MKSDSSNHSSIPEGFTISMAIVDALPVLLFGASAVVIASKFDSILFLIGAICCMIAGCGKVLWKLLIAATKKDIRLLNQQMLFLMPAGFLLIILALIIDRNQIEFSSVINALCSLPSAAFFAAGAIGMIAMGCFAVMLNSEKARSNWIEQITNTIAQACFLIGLLLL